ncbi:MAG: lytic transglycosylase domain-containing protein [Chloroflexota bacterium]
MILGLTAASPSTSEKNTVSEPIDKRKVEAVELEAKIAPLFTKEIHYWESQIIKWSNKWGLDPNLIATVMQIESCGDPKAVSVSGAIGLFQVMPFHFDPNDDKFDPSTNAKRGLSYLKRAQDTYNGDVHLTLAAYNAGITGASRPENLWPNETQRYVYWGKNIFTDASKGRSQSKYLDEWLEHGGYSLCQQASQRLGMSP